MAEVGSGGMGGIYCGSRRPLMSGYSTCVRAVRECFAFRMGSGTGTEGANPFGLVVQALVVEEHPSCVFLLVYKLFLLSCGSRTYSSTD
jgi:hypothetical protein